MSTTIPDGVTIHVPVSRPVDLYADRAECVEQEIVHVIESSEGVANAYREYDVEKIADRLVWLDTSGCVARFAVLAGSDEFWATVEEFALWDRGE